MKRNWELSDGGDVIDSRDIIARIEELTAEKEKLEAAVEEADDELNEHIEEKKEDIAHDDEEKVSLEGKLEECREALKDWEEGDEGEELKILLGVQSEGENCSSDFVHGEALISESYWEEHVEEMLKDCGDLPRDIPHYIAIDWAKTAENIAVDYSTITIDGTDYYIRSC